MGDETFFVNLSNAVGGSISDSQGIGTIQNDDLALTLSTLTNATGFTTDGESADDETGFSVSSIGDINGDGLNEIIIGAKWADPAAGSKAGQTYVVYGTTTPPGALDLSNLDGTNGFQINGAAGSEQSGFSVASADINGDGKDDLIIGAPFGSSSAGDVYVIFGATGIPANFNLSDLNGTNGFRFDGGSGKTGYSVSSAGDVNGDGIEDMLVGAPNYRSSAGAAYVVFGDTSIGSDGLIEHSDLNGTTGFRVDGFSSSDLAGFHVSRAGDVNGDGYDDFIIGACGANSSAGSSFVVFGAASFSSSFQISELNGSTGFRLNGIDASDQSGISVSQAGDINGDGYADLLVGANLADGGGDASGEAYVVFGKASGFSATINLTDLDGTNGFRIDGASAGDNAGQAVSGIGDVNGDGYDDFVVGAYKGGTGGETYIIFGNSTVGSTGSLELSTLTTSQGFRLDGAASGDYAGRAVSGAGDLNGDGFDDVLVGAPHADPSSNSNSGQAFVFYGGNFTGAVTHQGTSSADSLTGTSGANVMVGGGSGDAIVGNGGADVMRGGAGDDSLTASDLTFLRIDGGSGSDKLVLAGSGHSLNLTTTPNTKITSIEQIDINGSGANTITLNLGDVLDMSDTVSSNRTQLLIDGGADDTVTSTGQSWSASGTTSVSGNTYNVFVSGNAQLLVDTDIGTQTIN